MDDYKSYGCSSADARPSASGPLYLLALLAAIAVHAIFHSPRYPAATLVPRVEDTYTDSLGVQTRTGDIGR